MSGKNILAEETDSYTENEIYNILLIGKNGIGDKIYRKDTIIILNLI